MSYPLGKYGFGPLISKVVAMALLEGRVERWHCRWCDRNMLGRGVCPECDVAPA